MQSRHSQYNTNNETWSCEFKCIVVDYTVAPPVAQIDHAIDIWEHFDWT